jgi:hypothetical protein
VCQDPTGSRVVESHFSQRTREVGHPGAVMVLKFKSKSKVKGSGQECPSHASKICSPGGRRPRLKLPRAVQSPLYFEGVRFRSRACPHVSR